MINFIYARDRNHGIGFENKMPWYVPEDFRYFKSMTAGETVVMGRKTWDSLPIKPLPNRRNIVLSHDKRDDVEVIHSLDELRDLAKDRVVWVIGGASLFLQLYEEVDYVSESVIPGDYKCDAWVPHLSLLTHKLLEFKFVSRELLFCTNGMTVFTAVYRNVQKPSDPAFEIELRRRALQSQSKAKA